MIHVGFTGTRHGMSPAQIEAVTMIVKHLADTDRMLVAHHGDCVGADEDFNDIAAQFGAVVETHPGPVRSMRAFCDVDLTHDPVGFLARNRVIVKLSALVIATPFEPARQDRGGTWYTVDHARTEKKPLALVLPRRRGVVIEFSNWKWPDLPEEITR